MMTIYFRPLARYFEGHHSAAARYFPAVLAMKSNIMVWCEGSMFKSNSPSLATMNRSLGIAAAENKLSSGYGAEAETDPLVAKMSRPIAEFAGDHAQQRIGKFCANSRAD